MPLIIIERHLQLLNIKTSLFYLYNNGCIVITCFLRTDIAIFICHLFHVFCTLQVVEISSYS